jgi:hypothetical protein
MARIGWRFVDFSGWPQNENGILRGLARISSEGSAATGIPENPPESTSTRFDPLPNTRAHEDVSFFGPLGAFLLLSVCAALIVAFARRRASRVVGVLALALPLYALEIALFYRYNVWLGRFMIVPVALSAPLLSFVYPRRRLALCATCIGAAFLVLTISANETKPIGLRSSPYLSVLGADLGRRPVIWRLSREEAGALSNASVNTSLQLVAALVPNDARVGCALGSDDWVYPLYGSRLDRRLVMLRDDNALQQAEKLDLDWAVFNAYSSHNRGADSHWLQIAAASQGSYEGWSVFVRRGTAAERRVLALLPGLDSSIVRSS